jgi:hypothetical protein
MSGTRTPPSYTLPFASRSPVAVSFTGGGTPLSPTKMTTVLSRSTAASSLPSSVSRLWMSAW